MYCSLSVSKHLIFVHILAIQFLLIRTISSLNMSNAYLHHKCVVSQGKYQPGSIYERNLNELINSFFRGNFRSGFRQMGLGEGFNSVTLMYQCRADTYGHKCRSCYATALSTLRRRCPRTKGGIVWYDQCLVEISAIGTYGQVDYANNNCISNAENVRGDQLVFKEKMIGLLEKLNKKATSKRNIDANKQAVLYAAGEERLGRQKLYAMMQCTKDLWYNSCDTCLEWLVLRESGCCEDKQGCRVFSTSCSYRYELYPFVKTIV